MILLLPLWGKAGKGVFNFSEKSIFMNCYPFKKYYTEGRFVVENLDTKTPGFTKNYLIELVFSYTRVTFLGP